MPEKIGAQEREDVRRALNTVTALWEMYGLQGIPVFPCKADKSPWTANGFKNASTVLSQVRTWALRHPGCKWGVPTGKDSAWLVIDQDVRDGRGGPEEWLHICQEHGAEDRNTLTQVTPSGGAHAVFLMPEGVEIRNSTGKLAKGVDVKVDGGYVIVPPSDGYEWVGGFDVNAIEECPQWLLDLLAEPPAQVPHEAVRPAEEESIPQGKRNDTLASLAGTMRRKGVGEAGILAALRAENARCVPPLDDSEVQRIATSIAKYPAPAAGGTRTTDLDNAFRFRDQHRAVVRYCEEMGKWLVWDGRRWKATRGTEVRPLAHQTVQAIVAEALALGDTETRKELIKAAFSTLSSSRIAYMLTEAKAYVLIYINDLDQDVGYLTCANGVVNLANGELLPFDKARMSTRMTDIQYNPEAKCPKWLAALRLYTAGNEEDIAWLQRIVGYSLTGRGDGKCIAFIWGDGDNGKSTVLETLRMLAGEYALKTSVEPFLTARQGSAEQKNTPYTAQYKGARLVITDEMPEDRTLSAVVFKDMTGADTVKAMQKYQEPIEFRPTHLLWFYGNSAPTIKDDSEGLWERVRRLRFPVTIQREMRRPLGDILNDFREELPGILAWAVQGAMVALVDGIGASENVRAGTLAYREEQDLTRQYLEERCNSHPEYSVLRKELYRDYRTWCEDQGGIKPCGAKALSRRLAKRGYPTGRDANAWYIGLQLSGGTSPAMGHGAIATEQDEIPF